MLRGPRKLRTSLRFARDAVQAIARRFAVDGRRDSSRRPSHERLAILPTPGAKQESGAELIGSLDGYVHSAVVGRYDKHGFSIEPGVCDRVHDELGLARARRAGHHGQRFAPETFEGDFLGIIARKGGGERFN